MNNRVQFGMRVASALINATLLLSACSLAPDVSSPIITASAPQSQVPMATPIPPTATATPEPTATAEPTATPFIPEYFELGQTMTMDQVELSVRNFYALSDAELQALIGPEGENLWSYIDYRGDARPRTEDGTILNEKEQLGFVFDHVLTFGDVDYSDRDTYYNAVLLGMTTLTQPEGIYYVTVLGLQDFSGNRYVVYGPIAIEGLTPAACGEFNSSLYEGDRFFMKNIPFEAMEPAWCVQQWLNNFLGEVVLATTGQLINYNQILLIEGVVYLDKLLGDEVLRDFYLNGDDGTLIRQTFSDELLAEVIAGDRDITELPRIVLLAGDSAK